MPDMIGFGHSDTALIGTYKDNFSLLRQADLYELAAAEQGRNTVILVAHDMGQTGGLELMARQEEGKLPFRNKHAVLLNGSTLLCIVAFTEGEKMALNQRDQALSADPPKAMFVDDLRGDLWHKDACREWSCRRCG